MSDKMLRRRILQKRRNLSPEFIQQASLDVAHKVIALPEYRNAESIATYFAFDNEIDPSLITETSLEAGKNILLPVLTEVKTLYFAPFSPKVELIKNRYGISEPVYNKEDLLSVTQLDLVLIPLTVFDQHCNRMGMGEGYYDRTLALTTGEGPVKIGLAYEMQRTDALTARPWDVAMDKIVTEQHIYTQAHG